MSWFWASLFPVGGSSLRKAPQWISGSQEAWPKRCGWKSCVFEVFGFSLVAWSMWSYSGFSVDLDRDGPLERSSERQGRASTPELTAPGIHAVKLGCPPSVSQGTQTLTSWRQRAMWAPAYTHPHASCSPSPHGLPSEWLHPELCLCFLPLVFFLPCVIKNLLWL